MRSSVHFECFFLLFRIVYLFRRRRRLLLCWQMKVAEYSHRERCCSFLQSTANCRNEQRIIKTRVKGNDPQRRHKTKTSPILLVSFFFRTLCSLHTPPLYLSRPPPPPSEFIWPLFVLARCTRGKWTLQSKNCFHFEIVGV